MKNTWSSKLLIAGLTLVLVLAVGCDKPDAGAQLPTPTLGAQAVAGTPTPGKNEMPAGLELTAAANAGTLAPVNPTKAALVVSTATPLPPQKPQPSNTPLPAAPAASTPVPATAAPAQQPLTVPTGGTTYIVQSGDRLFSIGRMFNVDPYAIAQTNNIHAPFIIYPGQKLTIPGSGGVTPGPGPGNQTYTVQPGDNLFRIALRFGRPMQMIAAANNIPNAGLIFVGQVLIIP